MRHTRLIVMMLVLAAASAVLAQGADKDWTPLFNGKDLSGWKNYGAEKWTVENGEILGEAVTKEYGYLGTEKTTRTSR